MQLQWRLPDPDLSLRWRGPDNAIVSVVAAPPPSPVPTIIGPPGPEGPTGPQGPIAETIDGGTFN
jgi:hypothetical protein